MFACDDRLAVGVAKAAGQLGFRIPEDLSIIGCGSQVVGQVMTPELTSTPSYPERSASIAVEKLLTQIRNPAHRKSVTVLQIDELVIGGSTRIRRAVTEEAATERAPARVILHNN
ncbi:HTH-type transcriptional repressor PurR [bioreactor metagenome]|uniref:HTH-type transcriptional repressor PurR n=1 Tax=bioreactor metagenome TaxID=1076179 RepID=A0A645G1W4_9ZZZZ